MIELLQEILNSYSCLAGYHVKKVSKTSYQLFLVKKELDMSREVKVEYYYVTIYTNEIVNKKEKFGEATFQIYPTMSEEEIRNKIDEEITYCKYATNPKFKFAKKDTMRKQIKEVSFDGQSLKDAAFIAADVLFEADKYDRGYINSSEIFINFEDIRYVDSRGNDYSYQKPYGEIEFVVTWNEKNEEIEICRMIEFDSLDTNYIRNAANETLLEAGNKIKAVPTPLITNAKLLLTKKAVKAYFNYFKNKTNVESIYNKSSSYEIGKPIVEDGKHDQITIRLEPVMKKSTKGAPFDDNGNLLRRLPIIEADIVKNYWGNSFIAQYLHVPVKGEYENFIANEGSLEDEALEEEEYVEVVDFSGFGIDPITGDFGSEIRLGYYHKKGSKEPMIITSGSVSGSVSNSLSTVRFSSTKEQQDNFIGPKYVLLDNVKFTRGS